jgi:hypothetical protein
MNELDQVQCEIVTADLLYARVIHEYNYQALKLSKSLRPQQWWGPLAEAIPAVLLLGCFSALDQASFDLARIIAGSRQGRR